MKSIKKLILITGLALLLNAWAVAEEDDAVKDPAIENFDSKFALGLSMNYTGMFFFQGGNSGNFSSNLPLDFGVIAAFDWVTLQFNLSMINTFNGDFWKKSFDVQFDFYQKTMFWELFARYYRGFHLTSTGGGENGNIDFSWLSGGLYWLYILDHDTHSLQSVYSLNRKQNRSSGSFLLGANTIYFNIYSQDGNISRYAQRQHLLSFGPNAGCSYIWVFPRGFFLNLFALAGLNTSINVTEGDIFFTPQILPRFAAGYHGKTWSINMVLKSEFFLWQQEVSSADTTASMAFSITAMKRL